MSLFLVCVGCVVADEAFAAPRGGRDLLIVPRPDCGHTEANKVSPSKAIAASAMTLESRRRLTVAGVVFVAETSTIVVKTQPARADAYKRSCAHQRAWQAAAVGTIPATFVEGGAPDTRLTPVIACPHCPAGVALRPHAALSLLGYMTGSRKSRLDTASSISLRLKKQGGGKGSRDGAVRCGRRGTRNAMPSAAALRECLPSSALWPPHRSAFSTEQKRPLG